MTILYSAAVEVALARWQIAQQLSLWQYPEQMHDAELLVLHLGHLPE